MQRGETMSTENLPIHGQSQESPGHRLYAHLKLERPRSKQNPLVQVAGECVRQVGSRHPSSQHAFCPGLRCSQAGISKGTSMLCSVSEHNHVQLMYAAARHIGMCQPRCGASSHLAHGFAPSSTCQSQAKGACLPVIKSKKKCAAKTWHWLPDHRARQHGAHQDCYLHL